jgi:hypothetical protein
VGNDRGLPAAVQRGEAERLLPVAPALGEGAERAQGPRQPRPGEAPNVSERSRLSVHCLDGPPLQLGGPAEVANRSIYLPQVIGCAHLQGAIAKLGRQIEGLLARRHGAVVVSHQPADKNDPDQRPSQPISYTVNADCTGTYTALIPDGPSFGMFIAPTGEELIVIGTDLGVVLVQGPNRRVSRK